MKNIFKTVAALAAVVLAGCTNDFDYGFDAPEGGKTSVTIGLPESRTSLGALEEGKRKVYWSEGDQIAINGETSEAAKIDEENAGVATFDFSTAVLNYPYSVLYPAEAYKDVTTITLPASQSYTKGTFAVDASPMAAYATAAGEKIQLHHLAAVVRLQVKLAAENADLHYINRIEFRGNNNEQVSGDFAIDYTTATLSATSTAAADQIVKVSYAKSLATTATDFFVVVPAGEYANGFTVRVIDYAGHYMELSTAAITLEKGEVKAMPEFAFVPTGSTVDTEITIASASDWNTFAAAYNEGTYAGQVVSVNITADLVFDDDTNESFVTISDFKGSVNGNNKAFKNLKTDGPIFENVTSSELKDIVLDSSSKFNFENITFDASLYAAALANNIYYTTATNCVNKANVTVSGCISNNDSDTTICFGGIFARIDANSVVSNCANYGAITSTETNRTAIKDRANDIRQGGVVGYARGVVDGCTNDGAISAAFRCGTNAVGGIIGRANGDATVNGCVNNGTVSSGTQRLIDGGSGNQNRWIHIAGIVGQCACPLTNSTNNGNVETSSNSIFVNTGGIIGIIQGNNTVVFTGNSNTGNIYHNGAARYVSAAALIANTQGQIMPSEFDLKGCTLGGNITVQNLENHKSSSVYIGAVVAQHTTADNALVIKNANYTGNISYNAESQTTLVGVIRMGGLVGSTTALNTTNCTVTGEVAMNRRTGQQNGTLGHVGGIAGMVLAGASSIENCHVTNLVKEWHYNNNVFSDAAYNANCVGGIIGSYGYDKTQTLGTITINGCTFSGKLVNYRGTGGGIAGYLVNATVSNCNVTGNLIHDTAHVYTEMGGVVGAAENSTISNSWCKSNMTAKTAGSRIPVAGGVVGFLYTGSKVDKCAYYGTATVGSGTYCAGIAARVHANTEIKDCKFGGSIAGNAITADNVATYAVADGTATVSGTTLWDGTVTE